MSIKVTHIESEFVDERGKITRVLDQEKHKIRTILRITSKTGSIRSNHYHKKDYHYMYLESGMCEYSEKPANNPKSPIETVVMKAGDLVLTRPQIIHGVKFLKKSVLYAFTTEKRNQDSYEKDTVKVEIVK